MLSTVLFAAGTLTLSLNFVRLFGLAVSDWLYLAAFVSALVETIFVDREKFSCWTRNRFLWMAALIMIGGLISLTRASSLNTAVFEMLRVLFVSTIFISLIWILVRRGKTGLVVNALLISGLITACITAIDFFGGTQLGPHISGNPGSQLWGRFAGTLGHPNKFGYFLVLTTILTFAKISESKENSSGREWLWGAILLIQLLGIYLSGSLTAYLGLIAGVSALFVSMGAFRILSDKNLKFSFSLAGAVVILLVSATIINGDPPKGTIIGSTIERVTTQTAGSRLSTYEEAFAEIWQSPIIGAGFDQISTSGIDESDRLLQDSVHNAFLQIWYVGGVFSLAGLAAIYLNTFWHGIAVIREGITSRISHLEIGLAAAVISIMLMDQFQDSIYQREKWLLMGLFISHIWVKSKT